MKFLMRKTIKKKRYINEDFKIFIKSGNLYRLFKKKKKKEQLLFILL